MKNWKTTMGGVLTSLGLLMAQSSDETLKLVGGVVSAIGALILGWEAKDRNVTGGTVKQ